MSLKRVSKILRNRATRPWVISVAELSSFKPLSSQIPQSDFQSEKSQKLIKAIVINQNAPSSSKLIGEKLNKI